jgi:RNA polymerase sigma-70 factor (ECF subfamily)
LPGSQKPVDSVLMTQRPALVSPFESTATTDGVAVADLVRRARAGEGAAFEALVVAFERRVLRTALRLLGRPDLAEDAAQETFLRLHRYLHRFDVARDLGPWLYRVVVNVCHDLRRRSRSALVVPLEDERLEGLSEMRVDGTAIEQQAGLEWERRLLDAALASLPEKERAAIVLRDIEGLATREVARILGSSEGTVRSQISTGRVKIRHFVERLEKRP